MEIERNVQNIKLEHSQLLELVQPAFPHCRQLDEWGLLKGELLIPFTAFL